MHGLVQEHSAQTLCSLSFAGLRAQSVQKHSLTPQWDEDLYVLVQEPKTQNLRIQMFDRDLLNVKARAPNPKPSAEVEAYICAWCADACMTRCEEGPQKLHSWFASTRPACEPSSASSDSSTGPGLCPATYAHGSADLADMLFLVPLVQGEDAVVAARRSWCS